MAKQYILDYAMRDPRFWVLVLTFMRAIADERHEGDLEAVTPEELATAYASMLPEEEPTDGR